MAGISVLALTASGVLTASTPAEAQQTQWTGNTSSDWFNAANWNNGVPGSWSPLGTPPYDATINNGAANPASIGSAGATAGTLVVGKTAAGVLNITAGGGLTVNGYAGSPCCRCRSATLQPATAS